MSRGWVKHWVQKREGRIQGSDGGDSTLEMKKNRHPTMPVFKELIEC